MDPQTSALKLTQGDTRDLVQPLRFTDEMKAYVQLPSTDSCFPNLDPHGTEVVVGVPTNNSRKREVIKRVAKEKFGSSVLVWPQEIDSGENRQPSGSLEGIQDACVRMSAMIENFTCTLDGVCRVLVVGIESFVEPTDDSIPVDYAVEIVWDTGGMWKGAFTQGCVFPSRHVEEAKRIGTTVGKVISDNNAGVDHHDPHRRLCSESRYNLLTETLRELFETTSSPCGGTDLTTSTTSPCALGGGAISRLQQSPHRGGGTDLTTPTTSPLRVRTAAPT